MMAHSYRVDRAPGSDAVPRGALSYHPLGDVIANRTMFGPQLATRDRRLISGTPDHLVLQFWRTGGYRGEVGGEPITLRHGHVVLANRRRELDVRFARSDTAGLVVPRALLHGVDVDRLGTRLDPDRDRLARARIAALFRELPHMAADRAGPVGDGLLAFLRRLLDPSRAVDALGGAELDLGVVELARRAVEAELGSPSLSPDRVAELVGVSRATLYRAFAGEGGLMRSVWEQRLAAVATALADPLEARLLGRIAADTGFKSLAHLSRSFRERYGAAPRDWRQARVAEIDEARRSSPDALHRWWTTPGG